MNARASLVDVTDSRYQILPNPWIIGVPDSVLLANLADRRGNVWIPA